MSDAPRLRPQGVLELLDHSFRLYRDNFAIVVGLISVIFIPSQIVLLLVTGPISVELGTVMAKWQSQAQTSPDPALLKQMVGLFGTLFLVSAFFGAVVFPLATGALTRAVSRRLLGQQISLRDCYVYIFRNFGRYIGTLMLNGMAIGLGTMVCVVPGLLMAVWFVFTSTVVVVEGIGGTAAMGRSKQLSIGQAGRIVGMFVLMILTSGMIGAGVSAMSTFAVKRVALEPLQEFMAQQALQDVIQLLLTPFYAIGWVLLYYDIRVRNEGFDLEVRLASAEAAARPPQAPPPPSPAAA